MMIRLNSHIDQHEEDFRLTIQGDHDEKSGFFLMAVILE